MSLGILERIQRPCLFDVIYWQETKDCEGSTGPVFVSLLSPQAYAIDIMDGPCRAEDHHVIFAITS